MDKLCENNSTRSTTVVLQPDEWLARGSHGPQHPPMSNRPTTRTIWNRYDRLGG
jgi:hypothetical protein